ncbi:hypothetical protein LINPERHAP2_LOCUS38867 [Linum perenne]
MATKVQSQRFSSSHPILSHISSSTSLAIILYPNPHITHR